MRNKLKYRAINLCLLIGTITFGPSSQGDTLDIVTTSREYQKLEKKQRAKKQHIRVKKGAFLTPYESLFANERRPKELAVWLGVKLPGWKLNNHLFRITEEVAFASISMSNAQKVAITLSILVPKPQLQLLAEKRALLSLKKLAPPFIDVLASHPIDIQGINATYLREATGSCRLQIPIAKNGLLDLATPRCSDSNQMISVAKKLNVARLNGKLSQ